jgi:hypothetical protein
LFTILYTILNTFQNCKRYYADVRERGRGKRTGEEKRREEKRREEKRREEKRREEKRRAEKRREEKRREEKRREEKRREEKRTAQHRTETGNECTVKVGNMKERYRFEDLRGKVRITSK